MYSNFLSVKRVFICFRPSSQWCHQSLSLRNWTTPIRKVKSDKQFTMNQELFWVICGQYHTEKDFLGQNFAFWAQKSSLRGTKFMIADKALSSYFIMEVSSSASRQRQFSQVSTGMKGRNFDIICTTWVVLICWQKCALYGNIYGMFHF